MSEKKLKLYRNTTPSNDYQTSIDKLNDSTFIDTKDDGELLVNRFTDEDGQTRSILGVVGEGENGKYVEKIDMYQWDGGYYNMDIWKRKQEQKILVNIPGSIYFYDKEKDEFFLSKPIFDESWDVNRYSPIGVLVVPMNHNVYGDGSCGVMSIKPMNCSTPTTGGTSEQGMYWGDTSYNFQNILDYNVVCYVGSNGTVNSIIQGVNIWGRLPSDKFTTINNPYDNDTYYSNNDDDKYIPSPYLTDGSRNPAYYQTSSPSSTANAMSDFDGIGNTQKIITQRGTKDYSSWLPTYNTEADYPAASCCDMFYTDGTKQGDWYLPACGELGYIMPPFNKINQSIAALKSAYGDSVGVQLNTGDIWTSSEVSKYEARSIGATFGGLGYGLKTYSRYVRAWLRIGSL